MTRRPRATRPAFVALALATLIVAARPAGWSARAAAQDSSAQMDALVQEAIKAGQTPGAVVQLAKQGYHIHDRLLRPAEVVVAVPAD